MSNRFEGKVAVITGGNSGIGLATARAFVREGAKVVITGRDRKTLDAAAAELGAGTLALVSDAASTADAAKLVEAVKARHDRVDVLFVNAGIAKFAPFAESSEALFDETFAINVRGPFFLIQRFLPLMGEGGSIVLNTTAGTATGFATGSVYTASKAALQMVGRVLAAELAPRGIRVASVLPGPVETPIFGRLGMPAEAQKQMTEGLKTGVPLGRFGTADEIADAVLFLAGNGFVTGTELIVDGGYRN